MQDTVNNNPLRANTKKKADGFINLSVTFTDADGVEHRIKAPMFTLDADDAVQAALIQNPSLADHVSISIESIRKAHVATKPADVNLNFAPQGSLDLEVAAVEQAIAETASVNA